MTSSSRIIHHKTKNDYLARMGKPASNTEVKKAATSEVAKTADKVEVSSDSKVISKASAAGTESLEVLDKAKDVAQKVAKAPPVTPLVKAAEVAAPKAAQKVVQDSKPEVIDRPGIFFLEGLDLFSIVSSDGIGSMADQMGSAEKFSWSDESELLEAIKKRPNNQPIILVGHSLGGDSAINVANELNTIEHGFRQIDLIVTLDSVGFNNDIIPENVKRNLNFIGGSDALFNDGANIARDNNYTQVVNELRTEGHREIDDSRNVQFKIFKAIEETLKQAEIDREVDLALEKVNLEKKDLESFGKLPLKFR